MMETPLPLDIPMNAKHLTRSDKNIACPAPIGRGNIALSRPEGLVDSYHMMDHNNDGRHSESPVPVKRISASQVPRNVRFYGKHHYLWT